MVFGFVKQSGGHVKIYSELGRGTSVKLYLPRAGQSQGEPERPSAAERPAAANGETIMVVEDDAGVRELVVTLLIELGYRVLEAEDGVAALDRMKAGAIFDLLLTDVVLPRGISGPACAEAAKRTLPHLAVIYMSGYTQNAMQHNRLLGDGVHLIMKPFRKWDLAAKLRDALDQSRADQAR
jgi:CheY-like chemotaxis protein